MGEKSIGETLDLLQFLHLHQRQLDVEVGTDVDLGVEANFAVYRFDDVFGNGQPESRARILGGKIGDKDLVALVLGDARAIVRYLHRGVIVLEV